MRGKRDARNGHVFRDEQFSVRGVLCNVRDDIVIWRKRLPPSHVNSLLGWHAFISDCITNSFARHGLPSGGAN